MKLPRIVIGVLGVVLLGGTFGLGYSRGLESRPAIDQVTTLSGKTPSEGTTEVDFSPFWKAWNIINEKYVSNGSTSTPETITDQEKVWGAIAGLTGSLGDPYTTFFNPEEEELFETEVSGQFQGVGMEVGIKDGIITIVAPLKNTPAERAGVRAGDKIVKINDTATDGMTVDKAVHMIRGKGGTPVRLTLFREGDGVLPEITIIRTTINIPTADDKAIVIPVKGGKGSTAATAQTPEEKAKGIYVIRLFNFGGTSVETFKDKIQSFFNTGSDKLIIDLRGNPGGYLDAAIEIASLFLPEGAPIVREHFGKTDGEIVHKSRGYNVFPGKMPKIMVLVDGGSASAAEILASALQENGVAKLVGQKTFGKGSVQELVPLTDNTSLKITIARWYTPDGKSLSNGGLAPDYEVIPSKEDLAAKRDPQFDKAVELLLK